MKKELLKVVSHTPLNATVYELVLAGGSDMRAGQFVEVKAEGFYLRRPISVADCDEDRLVLLVKRVGEGTKKLDGLRAGDEVDVLTCLGNGFDATAQKPLLIGGGIGCAPLYKLAREFARKGVRPLIALGFARAEEIYYENEFKKFGDVILSTDDGSRGFHGNAVQAVKASGAEFDRFYACGPMPMLRAVSAAFPSGQVSLEARMGCGFGVCMGCSIVTTRGYARVCKEGPVFEASEVVWQ